MIIIIGVSLFCVFIKEWENWKLEKTNHQLRAFLKACGNQIHEMHNEIVGLEAELEQEREYAREAI